VFPPDRAREKRPLACTDALMVLTDCGFGRTTAKFVHICKYTYIWFHALPRSVRKIGTVLVSHNIQPPILPDTTIGSHPFREKPDSFPTPARP
jgi:hypothetical protein